MTVSIFGSLSNSFDFKSTSFVRNFFLWSETVNQTWKIVPTRKLNQKEKLNRT